MTISSVTSKVIYVGTGSTAAAAKVFAYPFRILADTDLTVSEYNTISSSATVKTLTTDYVVSGAGDSSGGNVTITGSYTNLPTNSQLVIQRVVPLTQETDYVENDSFPAETHEKAIDKLTMGLQQMQEQMDRAILADISQTASNINVVASVLAANYVTASSAAVAVAQTSSAVVYTTLASTYAGAIDFTKDTDPLLTSNSDLFVATQKAIKSYAASKVSPTFLGTTNTVTLTATLLTAGTVQTSGDIYSTVWTDYSTTSTIIGWSAYETKQVYYKVIGKTVFIAYIINGSSNATSVSFTTPKTATTSVNYNAVGYSIDNGGTAAAGLIAINSSTSTVQVFKNMGGSNNWTDSGTKIVTGQIWYESE